MAETEERPAPPPRRWHWLALAAAGVVLASGTVTTTLWWLMRDEPASAEAEVAEGPAPALYAPLRGPLLAHYTVGSRQRYLQVAMTALTRDPEVVAPSRSTCRCCATICWCCWAPGRSRSCTKKRAGPG